MLYREGGIPVKIPILIEPTSDRRFRAAGAEPFVGGVEADTPNAVLEQLRKLIDERLSRGALIAALELPEGGNPWLAGAGMFRDDPLFDDWQRAIADCRREADQDASAP